MNTSIRQIVAVTIGFALAGGVQAAESTSRTSMPDYCSNRDVTCVVPDDVPAQPRVGTTTGAGSGTVSPTTGLPTTPPGVATVPVVPSLGGNLPALPNAVAGVPGPIPSLTTSGTTVSSTSSGTAGNANLRPATSGVNSGSAGARGMSAK